MEFSQLILRIKELPNSLITLNIQFSSIMNSIFTHIWGNYFWKVNTLPFARFQQISQCENGTYWQIARTEVRCQSSSSSPVKYHNLKMWFLGIKYLLHDPLESMAVLVLLIACHLLHPFLFSCNIRECDCCDNSDMGSSELLLFSLHSPRELLVFFHPTTMETKNMASTTVVFSTLTLLTN